MYHHVQLVTILANSAFQRSALFIRVCTSAYHPLLCMYWSLLWKAEFARIVTSGTRWYIQRLSRDVPVAVPYYSMVCTKLYLVWTSMNDVVLICTEHVRVCTWYKKVHTSMYRIYTSTYWYVPGLSQYILFRDFTFILRTWHEIVCTQLW